MASVQKKKNPDPKVPKKRRSRSKFRPTFKDRCIYSFSMSLEAMDKIRSLTQDRADSNEIGMKFISCNKYLSHSIEMLCKATLEQRSFYLILEKIGHFDSLNPKEEAIFENTCGALVSLARASKLFRKQFSKDDLGKLVRILNSRNQSEHGAFSITDFKSELRQIASAYEIVVKIYNNQFRNVDLIEDCGQYAPDNVTEVCNKVIKENSHEFEKIEKKIKALKKSGLEFMYCASCYYEFAKLSNQKDSYECLLCKDTRVKKVCSANDCKREFWDARDSSTVKCGGLHLNSFIKGSPLGEIESANNNPFLSLSSIFGDINASTKQTVYNSLLKANDDLQRQINESLRSSYSPWGALSNLANPRSEESTLDENSNEETSAIEKKNPKK